AELRHMAESVGRWLQDCGMPRGARAAILAANSPRWVAAYLGIIAAGGVAVPFDTAFTSSQVEKLLVDSGSGCLFTDRAHLKVAIRATAGLRILLVLLDWAAPEVFRLDEILGTGPGNFIPAELTPDDPAVILYTSGTTSDPKGVLLSHDNLLAEMEAVFSSIHIETADSILGILPLFHALAQMANLLLPFAIGARVVYLESLNVTELMRALRESKVTLFCCVPQFFYLIHERIRKQVKGRGKATEFIFHQLLKLARSGRSFGLNLGKIFFKQAHAALGPSIRMLITGGSRFDPAIARELDAMGFEILQAYGLTETSGGATCTRPGRNVIGSVGQPLQGIEVEIVDPEPREDGPAAGEIAIRGRIVMRGYWNRPDATAEVVRDGWLYTGDLGYIDETGNLFITGRRKEVIVLSSGKNIYPEELETHYAQSPFVKEICVLGMDGRSGESSVEHLHAVIVPDYEVSRERKVVNLRDVIRFDIEGLSAQLPSTKRILSYDIWQHELPRTTTRKLKRYEIASLVLSGADAGGDQQHRVLTESDAAWVGQPENSAAMAVVRSFSKNGREVHPSDNLELDLGLDSINRIELLVQLETALGMSVPDSVASEVYTVREMVDALRARATHPAAAEQFAGWEAVLAVEPADPAVLSIARRRTVNEAFWFIGTRLLNLFCRDRYRLKVKGLEKLPPRGPFILSPNHQSLLDAPVVWSILPWDLFRNTVHLGTSEIWGWGWRRRLARSMNLMIVDPDSNLVAGLRAGAFALRHGKVLALYPEGERSIDGRPKVFKRGAAILATHIGVPIVPVAIDGFFEAWPRGKPPQRFTHLRVRFGDPIPSPSLGPNPEQTYEQLTAELRSRVVSMWEEIHGPEPSPGD
ncbi:MAG: AMP-binding protein, partial [Acidobacteria bacterium]|nr:AMP-binding protein [Acidobacteriota bacterium]